MADQVQPPMTTMDGQGRQRSRWTSFAALGLLMIAMGPLVMLLSGFAYGLDLGEDFGFFLTLIAIPLVAAILVWYLPWWTKIIGLLAALAAGFGMFWAAFGLMQPQSAFDFVPGLLIVPGVLMAVVGSIAGIVAARRGNTGSKATGGERTAIRSVLAGVVVLALVSAVLTFAGQQKVSDSSAATTTIFMKNFTFNRSELEVSGGDSIFVRNDDPFYHTFTIEELGIDVDFQVGDEALIQLPDKPGTYRFRCEPHSSSDESEEKEDDESASDELDDEEEDDGMDGEITIS